MNVTIQSLRYAADHTGYLYSWRPRHLVYKICHCISCIMFLSEAELFIYQQNIWLKKYFSLRCFSGLVMGSFSFTCSIFPTSVLDSGLLNLDLIVQEYEPGKLGVDPPPLNCCPSINHYCGDVCVFIHSEAHTDSLWFCC